MSQLKSTNRLDNVSLHRLKLVGSIAIVTGLLAAGLIAVWWAYDVWQDRRHTVVVTADTPLFKGTEENCGGKQIATLHPGTKPQVRRIRYWKNCATIDVVSPDGQKGFIVLGDGNVSVNPRLP